MFIESLSKGLAVLEAFKPDKPDLSLSEIARLADITMGSAQRITFTLVSLGYLEKDEVMKTYRVGPRVMGIARSYMQSVDLQRASQLPMQQLAQVTGETVNVSVRSGTDIVYVLRMPNKDSMILPDLWVGSNLPLQYTSMGRVLLAHLPESECELVMRDMAFPFTTNAREVQEDSFRADLDLIRQQGFAVNDRDLRPDLRSVAAPILDSAGNAVAALGIAVRAGHYNLNEIDTKLVPPLLREASAISRNLGYSEARDERRIIANR